MLIHLLIYKFIYLYIFYFTICEFFSSGQLLVVHWSLSDSKSPQFSWTLMSIWADFNYFTPGKFFTHALTDGHSLESWWKQVFSSFLDSFHNSHRSHWSCSLGSFDSFFDFQPFQSSFQDFWYCSKCAHDNWYHRHLHVLQFFLVLWQGPSTCLAFRFLWFSLCVPLGHQSPLNSKFAFFCWLSRGLVGIRWSVCISKSQRILCVSFFRADSGLCLEQLEV